MTDEFDRVLVWWYASAEDIVAQPQLGDLFRLKVGAHGLPQPKFAG